MPRKLRAEKSSGNVFADLALPNPEDRLAKASLAFRIAQAIRSRQLTAAPPNSSKSINPKSRVFSAANSQTSPPTASCAF